MNIRISHILSLLASLPAAARLRWHDLPVPIANSEAPTKPGNKVLERLPIAQKTHNYIGL